MIISFVTVDGDRRLPRVTVPDESGTVQPSAEAGVTRTAPVRVTGVGAIVEVSQSGRVSLPVPPHFVVAVHC